MVNVSLIISSLAFFRLCTRSISFKVGSFLANRFDALCVLKLFWLPFKCIERLVAVFSISLNKWTTRSLGKKTMQFSSWMSFDKSRSDSPYTGIAAKMQFDTLFFNLMNRENFEFSFNLNNQLIIIINFIVFLFNLNSFLLIVFKTYWEIFSVKMFWKSWFENKLAIVLRTDSIRPMWVVRFLHRAPHAKRRTQKKHSAQCFSK